MLSIYTSADLISQIEQLLHTDDRLNEWVEVLDLASYAPVSTANALIITAKEGIQHPLDWENAAPPYLMPESVAFTPAHLLGLLYFRLGNLEKAYGHLAASKLLLNEIDLVNRLQQGMEADPARLVSDFQPFEEFRFCHNAAILHYYGSAEGAFHPEKVEYFFREALKAAPDSEYHAFSARQFAEFLIDAGHPQAALIQLEEALRHQPSADAIAELKAAQVQAWKQQLVVPYDETLLARLKETLWEVLAHYEANGRKPQAALTLVDAAQIANYSDSFAESLGYLQRALDLFREEEMPEMEAQAQYRKGILLYTWAKKGNPQFFRGAIDSFQDALKVFTLQEAPEVYADVHQYLGVIYAEIPDEPQKRSIWAGVSAAAFQQALSVFTKEQYPYEYAAVCTHFANALNLYPEAVHSDNRQKAIAYYEEALSVRTAEEWPLERAMTLLNYVETAWHLGLEDNDKAASLYDNMVAMAREARDLTKDPKIQSEAVLHLSKLNQLRDRLAEEAAGTHSA